MAHMLVVLCVMVSCSRKPVYTCGLGYLESLPSLDSKVLQLERLAIADTIMATVSCTVLGKKVTETSFTSDTLLAARISAVDYKTGKVLEFFTDLNGTSDFNLLASTYDLKISYIGYNTLIIRNVKMGPGDIWSFKSLLGQFGAVRDSTVYIMLPDRNFKMISRSKN